MFYVLCRCWWYIVELNSNDSCPHQVYSLAKKESVMQVNQHKLLIVISSKKERMRSMEDLLWVARKGLPVKVLKSEKRVGFI